VPSDHPPFSAFLPDTAGRFFLTLDSQLSSLIFAEGRKLIAGSFHNDSSQGNAIVGEFA
jgi:hypothetical protein